MIELGKKLTVIIPSCKGDYHTSELITQQFTNGYTVYYDCEDRNYHPRDVPAGIRQLVNVHIHQQKQQLVLFTMSPYVITTINNLILAYDVRDKQKLYPEEILLNYDDVRAYDCSNGDCIDIMNKEYRLIDAERLDEVSNKIGAEYNQLLELQGSE